MRSKNICWKPGTSSILRLGPWGSWEVVADGDYLLNDILRRRVHPCPHSLVNYRMRLLLLPAQHAGLHPGRITLQFAYVQTLLRYFNQTQVAKTLNDSHTVVDRLSGLMSIDTPWDAGIEHDQPGECTACRVCRQPRVPIDPEPGHV